MNTIHEPEVLTFAPNNNPIKLSSTHAIVDPNYHVPDLYLSFTDDVFNEYFGIPFQDNFLLLIFVHIIFPKFQLYMV